MPDLLKVKNLKIAFHGSGESIEVVHGIDFSVAGSGQTVAILGESGSGKSVTCLSLTNLLPQAPSCTVSGEILFAEKDILRMSGKELRKIRGAGIAYIFQEPSASLNPVFTVGYQIEEAVRLHRPDLSDAKAR
ncbi:MAG: ATP-binding cassette domain-containing protein, partial [Verrucomicrobiota bacterium]|nr:ATP-binding cassette domain-containing protein [Verrucomicrobiota bacterium]